MSRTATESKCNVESLRSQVLIALRTLRPLIQRDGGDVALVDVSDEGVARVRLLGACVSCPSSEMTLTNGIEKRLQEAVPGVVRVERVM